MATGSSRRPTAANPAAVQPVAPSAEEIAIHDGRRNPERELAGRVLFVEDDDAVRHAVTEALRLNAFAVVAMADGSGFVDVLDEFGPDILLLDVYLPNGVSGFDLARSARGRSRAAVMFLTAGASLRERLSGFELGAEDYLVKPFAMPELIARLRVLARRTSRSLSTRIEVRDLIIDEVTYEVTRANQPIKLTSTEFRLLGVLAREPGRLFSKVQLLSQVWGFDKYDTNLVEVHISSLRRKLEAHGPRVIHTEWNRGYVMSP
jgi:DNA-binding response OmpR family regulator